MTKEFIKGVRIGMEEFGLSISTLVNSFLLLIVYLLGIGLTAMFARIVGKKFLETRIDKKAKTYWSDINLKKSSIEDYYRQF